jgi:hypothetical protein
MGYGRDVRGYRRKVRGWNMEESSPLESWGWSNGSLLLKQGHAGGRHWVMVIGDCVATHHVSHGLCVDFRQDQLMPSWQGTLMLDSFSFLFSLGGLLNIKKCVFYIFWSQWKLTIWLNLLYIHGWLFLPLICPKHWRCSRATSSKY